MGDRTVEKFCKCKCHPPDGYMEICRECCVRTAQAAGFELMMKQNKTALDLQAKLDVALLENGELLDILQDVYDEYKDDMVCDCGTDEPGTCAYCRVSEAVKAKSQKQKCLCPHHDMMPNLKTCLCCGQTVGQ